MNTALHIHDLRVVLGRRTVLTVPELTVPEGEMLAILGRNGAGKSTLLRACLGLHRFRTGHLRLLGRSVGELRGRECRRLRQQVGYISQIQNVNGYLPLTVREVAAMGLTSRFGLFQRMGREDWRAVDHWLERFGLATLADRSYSDLSGGEQRKTLLARVMAQKPRLLLLDEPTAFLDLGWRESILVAIEDLFREMGLTILLVCHEPEVLPAGCQRVMLLENGSPTAIGRTREVLTDERVSAFYGWPFRVVCRDGRYAAIPDMKGRT